MGRWTRSGGEFDGVVVGSASRRYRVFRVHGDGWHRRPPGSQRSLELRAPFVQASLVVREPALVHDRPHVRVVTGQPRQAPLAVAGPGARTHLLAVALRHLGGTLARPPSVADAVGPRDAAYLLQTVGVLAGPHAAEVPADLAAVRSAMAEWSTGATFVNLHGTPGDDADRARAWPAETYERLRRVKGRYDPAGLPRSGHAVPPAT